MGVLQVAAKDSVIKKLKGWLPLEFKIIAICQLFASPPKRFFCQNLAREGIAMSRTAALSGYRLYPAILFWYAHGQPGTAVFSRPSGKASRSRLHPHLLDRRHSTGQHTRPPASSPQGGPEFPMAVSGCLCAPPGARTRVLRRRAPLPKKSFDNTGSRR